LIGSILANVLLVLGSAFIAGGIRHGTQRFNPEEPRLHASLLLLAVAALLVPTLAFRLGTPAAAHISALSDACAVVLLVVDGATTPFNPRQRVAAPDPASAAGDSHRSNPWPLALSVILLAIGSLGAALASDWFVSALQPAISSLGLSQAFT